MNELKMTRLLDEVFAERIYSSGTVPLLPTRLYGDRLDALPVSGLRPSQAEVDSLSEFQQRVRDLQAARLYGGRLDALPVSGFCQLPGRMGSGKLPLATRKLLWAAQAWAALHPELQTETDEEE